MKILWNEVTKQSQIVAIVLFVAVFAIAFGLGVKYSSSRAVTTEPSGKIDPNAPGYTVYECADGKSIWAAYSDKSVTLSLSDGSSITLPQATSASGARFANEDESVVFWNKGTDAFIQQDEETTYADCEQKNS